MAASQVLWVPKGASIMNKFFGSAFFSLCFCLSHAAYAANEIRMNAPVIHVERGQWVAAPPLLGVPQVASTECTVWTPAESTINAGTLFQQSRSCVVTSNFSVQNREMLTTTGAFRNVGEPKVDSSTETKPETRQSAGTKPLSGIQDVQYGGKTFKAYVDNSNSDGNWILVARWVGLTPTILTFDDLVVKGKPVKSYSNDPVNFPVMPIGTINQSDTVLFVSENARWNAKFGPWVRFSTFPIGNIQNNAGFPALGGYGQALTFFHPWLGWYATGSMTQEFGLWTRPNNSGDCGGAGVAAAPENRICPITSNNSGFGAHADLLTVKKLYVKGQ